MARMPQTPCPEWVTLTSFMAGAATIHTKGAASWRRLCCDGAPLTDLGMPRRLRMKIGPPARAAQDDESIGMVVGAPREGPDTVGKLYSEIRTCTSQYPRRAGRDSHHNRRCPYPNSARRA